MERFLYYINFIFWTLILIILGSPAIAVEYEIIIEPVDYFQPNISHRVQLRQGLWNGQALSLSDFSHTVEDKTEILLSFEKETSAEIVGFPYSLVLESAVGSSASFAHEGVLQIQSSEVYRGNGAALFTQGLELTGERGSMFEANTVWGNFTIEFWIYPSKLDSSTEILSWTGRSNLGGSITNQQILVSGRGTRIEWNFENMFLALIPRVNVGAANAITSNEPVRPNIGTTIRPQYHSIQLGSRREIIPRRWSHHLIRYDSERGLIEYLMDGRSEDIAYLSDSGTEQGNAFLPHIGNISLGNLVIAGNYSGFMDDFRIQRQWIEKANLDKVEKEPGYAILGPISMNRSQFLSFNAMYRSPGNSEVIFSALRQNGSIQDSRFVPRLNWIPIVPNTPVNIDGLGNNLYLRVDFLPDGSAVNVPILQTITIRQEDYPIPPAPVGIIARAVSNADVSDNADVMSNADVSGNADVMSEAASIRLSWNRVLGAEGYLLYYGDEPGSYFGNEGSAGASPVDIGNTDSFTLNGLRPGEIYYFKIASYNKYNNPSRGLSLERRLSTEVFARTVLNR